MILLLALVHLIYFKWLHVDTWTVLWKLPSQMVALSIHYSKIDTQIKQCVVKAIPHGSSDCSSL
jgi:hypothetical protein